MSKVTIHMKFNTQLSLFLPNDFFLPLAVLVRIIIKKSNLQLTTLFVTDSHNENLQNSGKLKNLEFLLKTKRNILLLLCVYVINDKK